MQTKRGLRSTTSVLPTMRDRIKEVATELLILHGYNGVSFRDIAQRLAVTTTNLHYHFGTKQGLVEEVLKDYVASARMRHLEIWLDEETTLQEKLGKVVQYNHERYVRLNKPGEIERSWSLIGRLRLESEVLSDAARESLASFTVAVHEAIEVAVDNAWRKGELSEDTPREALAFLIINVVNSSSVFTQGAGGFDRLKLFFDAFSSVIVSAYDPRLKPSKR